MRFRVRDGQQLIQRDEDGATVVRMGGDIVEGPEDWIADFRGTLEALGPNGEPIDDRNALMVELAKSQHAHEHVGFLRAYLEHYPGDPQLRAWLDAAETQARKDQQRHAAESAARPPDPVVVTVDDNDE